MTDRLYRSRDDRMILGVAGGVAETLDADPSIIRVVWAVLAVLTGGIALLVYVVMAIVVPERPAGMPYAPPEDPSNGQGATDPTVAGSPSSDGSPVGSEPGRRHRRRRDRDDRTRGGLVAGLILIVLGGFFLVRQFLPVFDLSFWWPMAAIGLGVVLVVLALVPPRRSS